MTDHRGPGAGGERLCRVRGPLRFRGEGPPAGESRARRVREARTAFRVKRKPPRGRTREGQPRMNLVLRKEEMQ